MPLAIANKSSQSQNNCKKLSVISKCKPVSTKAQFNSRSSDSGKSSSCSPILLECSFDSGIAGLLSDDNAMQLHKRIQQCQCILLALERDQEYFLKIRNRLSKITNRKHKPSNENELFCNVCCTEIDVNDGKTYGKCHVCKKYICRNIKCADWLPKTGEWECDLCQTSKDSLAQTSSWVADQITFNQEILISPTRARSEVYIPISEYNESLIHLESVSQCGATLNTITAEQKFKIREYVEEVVASLLGGNLDSVAVNQLSKSENYLPGSNVEPIRNGSPAEGVPIKTNGHDLSGISETRLRQMIQKIIAETITCFPSLANGYAGSDIVHDMSAGTNDNRQLSHGGLSHHVRTSERYFEPTIYQDLLATAVLNKIADRQLENIQNSSARNTEPGGDDSNDNLMHRSSDQNFNIEKLSTSSGSSVAPRSDCSYPEVEQIFNNNDEKLSELLRNSDRDSIMSDYLANHMILLPEINAVATESEEDDYTSVTSSAVGDETWEKNWLFKKKKCGLSGSVTTSSISMLVPDPKEDVRAQIGDKTADEVSDLSELGSDSDDSLNSLRSHLEPINDRLINKHLIGGQNSKIILDELIERSSMISNILPNDSEPVYTDACNEHLIDAKATNEAVNDNVKQQLQQPRNANANEENIVLDVNSNSLTASEVISESDGCTGFSAVEIFESSGTPSVVEILAAMALGPMLAVPSIDQPIPMTVSDINALTELKELALAEIKAHALELTPHNLDVIPEESGDVTNQTENVFISSEELDFRLQGAETLYQPLLLKEMAEFKATSMPSSEESPLLSDSIRTTQTIFIDEEAPLNSDVETTHVKGATLNERSKQSQEESTKYVSDNSKISTEEISQNSESNKEKNTTELTRKENLKEEFIMQTASMESSGKNSETQVEISEIFSKKFPDFQNSSEHVEVVSLPTPQTQQIGTCSVFLNDATDEQTISTPLLLEEKSKKSSENIFKEQNFEPKIEQTESFIETSETAYESDNQTDNSDTARVEQLTSENTIAKGLSKSAPALNDTIPNINIRGAHLSVSLCEVVFNEHPDSLMKKCDESQKADMKPINYEPPNDEENSLEESPKEVKKPVSAENLLVCKNGEYEKPSLYTKNNIPNKFSNTEDLERNLIYGDHFLETQTEIKILDEIASEKVLFEYLNLSSTNNLIGQSSTAEKDPKEQETNKHDETLIKESQTDFHLYRFSMETGEPVNLEIITSEQSSCEAYETGLEKLKTEMQPNDNSDSFKMMQNSSGKIPQESTKTIEELSDSKSENSYALIIESSKSSRDTKDSETNTDSENIFQDPLSVSVTPTLTSEADQPVTLESSKDTGGRISEQQPQYTGDKTEKQPIANSDTLKLAENLSENTAEEMANPTEQIWVKESVMDTATLTNKSLKVETISVGSVEKASKHQPKDINSETKNQINHEPDLWKTAETSPKNIINMTKQPSHSNATSNLIEESSETVMETETVKGETISEPTSLQITEIPSEEPQQATSGNVEDQIHSGSNTLEVIDSLSEKIPEEIMKTTEEQSSDSTAEKSKIALNDDTNATNNPIEEFSETVMDAATFTSEADEHVKSEMISEESSGPLYIEKTVPEEPQQATSSNVEDQIHSGSNTLEVIDSLSEKIPEEITKTTEEQSSDTTAEKSKIALNDDTNATKNPIEKFSETVVEAASLTHEADEHVKSEMISEGSSGPLYIEKTVPEEPQQATSGNAEDQIHSGSNTLEVIDSLSEKILEEITKTTEEQSSDTTAEKSKIALNDDTNATNNPIEEFSETVMDAATFTSEADEHVKSEMISEESSGPLYIEKTVPEEPQQATSSNVEDQIHSGSNTLEVIDSLSEKIPEEITKTTEEQSSDTTAEKSEIALNDDTNATNNHIEKFSETVVEAASLTHEADEHVKSKMISEGSSGPLYIEKTVPEEPQQATSGNAEDQIHSGSNTLEVIDSLSEKIPEEITKTTEEQSSDTTAEKSKIALNDDTNATKNPIEKFSETVVEAASLTHEADEHVKSEMISEGSSGPLYIEKTVPEEPQQATSGNAEDQIHSGSNTLEVIDSLSEKILEEITKTTEEQSSDTTAEKSKIALNDDTNATNNPIEEFSETVMDAATFTSEADEHVKSEMISEESSGPLYIEKTVPEEPQQATSGNAEDQIHSGSNTLEVIDSLPEKILEEITKTTEEQSSDTTAEKSKIALNDDTNATNNPIEEFSETVMDAATFTSEADEHVKSEMISEESSGPLYIEKTVPEEPQQATSGNAEDQIHSGSNTLEVIDSLSEKILEEIKKTTEEQSSDTTAEKSKIALNDDTNATNNPIEEFSEIVMDAASLTSEADEHVKSEIISEESSGPLYIEKTVPEEPQQATSGNAEDQIYSGSNTLEVIDSLSEKIPEEITKTTEEQSSDTTAEKSKIALNDDTNTTNNPNEEFSETVVRAASLTHEADEHVKSEMISEGSSGPLYIEETVPEEPQQATSGNAEDQIYSGSNMLEVIDSLSEKIPEEITKTTEEQSSDTTAEKSEIALNDDTNATNNHIEKFSETVVEAASLTHEADEHVKSEMISEGSSGPLYIEETVPEEQQQATSGNAEDQIYSESNTLEVIDSLSEKIPEEITKTTEEQSSDLTAEKSKIALNDDTSATNNPIEEFSETVIEAATLTSEADEYVISEMISEGSSGPLYIEETVPDEPQQATSGNAEDQIYSGSNTLEVIDSLSEKIPEEITKTTEEQSSDTTAEKSKIALNDDTNTTNNPNEEFSETVVRAASLTHEADEHVKSEMISEGSSGPLYIEETVPEEPQQATSGNAEDQIYSGSNMLEVIDSLSEKIPEEITKTTEEQSSDTTAEKSEIALNDDTNATNNHIEKFSETVVEAASLTHEADEHVKSEMISEGSSGPLYIEETVPEEQQQATSGNAEDQIYSESNTLEVIDSLSEKIPEEITKTTEEQSSDLTAEKSKIALNDDTSATNNPIEEFSETVIEAATLTSEADEYVISEMISEGSSGPLYIEETVPDEPQQATSGNAEDQIYSGSNTLEVIDRLSEKIPEEIMKTTEEQSSDTTAEKSKIALNDDTNATNNPIEEFSETVMEAASLTHEADEHVKSEMISEGSFGPLYIEETVPEEPQQATSGNAEDQIHSGSNTLEVKDSLSEKIPEEIMKTTEGQSSDSTAEKSKIALNDDTNATNNAIEEFSETVMEAASLTHEADEHVKSEMISEGSFGPLYIEETVPEEPQQATSSNVEDQIHSGSNTLEVKDSLSEKIPEEIMKTTEGQSSDSTAEKSKIALNDDTNATNNPIEEFSETVMEAASLTHEADEHVKSEMISEGSFGPLYIEETVPEEPQQATSGNAEDQIHSGSNTLEVIDSLSEKIPEEITKTTEEQSSDTTAEKSKIALNDDTNATNNPIEEFSETVVKASSLTHEADEHVKSEMISEGSSGPLYIEETVPEEPQQATSSNVEDQIHSGSNTLEVKDSLSEKIPEEIMKTTEGQSSDSTAEKSKIALNDDTNATNNPIEEFSETVMEAASLTHEADEHVKSEMISEGSSGPLYIEETVPEEPQQATSSNVEDQIHSGSNTLEVKDSLSEKIPEEIMKTTEGQSSDSTAEKSKIALNDDTNATNNPIEEFSETVMEAASLTHEADEHVKSEMISEGSFGPLYIEETVPEEPQQATSGNAEDQIHSGSNTLEVIDSLSEKIPEEITKTTEEQSSDTTAEKSKIALNDDTNATNNPIEEFSETVVKASSLTHEADEHVKSEMISEGSSGPLYIEETVPEEPQQATSSNVEDQIHSGSNTLEVKDSLSEKIPEEIMKTTEGQSSDSTAEKSKIALNDDTNATNNPIEEFSETVMEAASLTHEADEHVKSEMISEGSFGPLYIEETVPEEPQQATSGNAEDQIHSGSNTLEVIDSLSEKIPEEITKTTEEQSSDTTAEKSKIALNDDTNATNNPIEEFSETVVKASSLTHEADEHVKSEMISEGSSGPLYIEETLPEEPQQATSSNVEDQIHSGSNTLEVIDSLSEKIPKEITKSTEEQSSDTTAEKSKIAVNDDTNATNNPIEEFSETVMDAATLTSEADEHVKSEMISEESSGPLYIEETVPEEPQQSTSGNAEDQIHSGSNTLEVIGSLSEKIPEEIMKTTEEQSSDSKAKKSKIALDADTNATNNPIEDFSETVVEAASLAHEADEHVKSEMISEGSSGPLYIEETVPEEPQQATSSNVEDQIHSDSNTLEVIDSLSEKIPKEITKTTEEQSSDTTAEKSKIALNDDTNTTNNPIEEFSETVMDAATLTSEADEHVKSEMISEESSGPLYIEETVPEEPQQSTSGNAEDQIHSGSNTLEVIGSLSEKIPEEIMKTTEEQSSDSKAKKSKIALDADTNATNNPIEEFSETVVEAASLTHEADEHVKSEMISEGSSGPLYIEETVPEEPQQATSGNAEDQIHSGSNTLEVIDSLSEKIPEEITKTTEEQSSDTTAEKSKIALNDDTNATNNPIEEFSEIVMDAASLTSEADEHVKSEIISEESSGPLYIEKTVPEEPQQATSGNAEDQIHSGSNTLEVIDSLSEKIPEEITKTTEEQSSDTTAEKSKIALNDDTNATKNPIEEFSETVVEASSLIHEADEHVKSEMISEGSSGPLYIEETVPEEPQQATSGNVEDQIHSGSNTLEVIDSLSEKIPEEIMKTTEEQSSDSTAEKSKIALNDETNATNNPIEEFSETVMDAATLTDEADEPVKGETISEGSSRSLQIAETVAEETLQTASGNAKDEINSDSKTLEVVESLSEKIPEEMTKTLKQQPSDSKAKNSKIALNDDTIATNNFIEEFPEIVMGTTTLVDEGDKPAKDDGISAERSTPFQTAETVPEEEVQAVSGNGEDQINSGLYTLEVIESSTEKIPEEMMNTTKQQPSDSKVENSENTLRGHSKDANNVSKKSSETVIDTNEGYKALKGGAIFGERSRPLQTAGTAWQEKPRAESSYAEDQINCVSNTLEVIESSPEEMAKPTKQQLSAVKVNNSESTVRDHTNDTHNLIEESSQTVMDAANLTHEADEPVKGESMSKGSSRPFHTVKTVSDDRSQTTSSNAEEEQTNIGLDTLKVVESSEKLQEEATEQPSEITLREKPLLVCLTASLSSEPVEPVRAEEVAGKSLREIAETTSEEQSQAASGDAHPSASLGEKLSKITMVPKAQGTNTKSEDLPLKFKKEDFEAQKPNFLNEIIHEDSQIKSNCLYSHILENETAALKIKNLSSFEDLSVSSAEKESESEDKKVSSNTAKDSTKTEMESIHLSENRLSKPKLNLSESATDKKLDLLNNTVNEPSQQIVKYMREIVLEQQLSQPNTSTNELGRVSSEYLDDLNGLSKADVSTPEEHSRTSINESDECTKDEVNSSNEFESKKGIKEDKQNAPTNQIGLLQTAKALTSEIESIANEEQLSKIETETTIDSDTYFDCLNYVSEDIPIVKLSSLDEIGKEISERVSDKIGMEWKSEKYDMTSANSVDAIGKSERQSKEEFMICIEKSVEMQAKRTELNSKIGEQLKSEKNIAYEVITENTLPNQPAGFDESKIAELDTTREGTSYLITSEKQFSEIQITQSELTLNKYSGTSANENCISSQNKTVSEEHILNVKIEKPDTQLTETGNNADQEASKTKAELASDYLSYTGDGVNSPDKQSTEIRVSEISKKQDMLEKKQLNFCDKQFSETQVELVSEEHLDRAINVTIEPTKAEINSSEEILKELDKIISDIPRSMDLDTEESYPHVMEHVLSVNDVSEENKMVCVGPFSNVEEISKVVIAEAISVEKTIVSSTEESEGNIRDDVKVLKVVSDADEDLNEEQTNRKLGGEIEECLESLVKESGLETSISTAGKAASSREILNNEIMLEKECIDLKFDECVAKTNPKLKEELSYSPVDAISEEHFFETEIKLNEIVCTVKSDLSNKPNDGLHIAEVNTSKEVQPEVLRTEKFEKMPPNQTVSNKQSKISNNKVDELLKSEGNTEKEITTEKHFDAKQQEYIKTHVSIMQSEKTEIIDEQLKKHTKEKDVTISPKQSSEVELYTFEAQTEQTKLLAKVLSDDDCLKEVDYSSHIDSQVNLDLLNASITVGHNLERPAETATEYSAVHGSASSPTTQLTVLKNYSLPDGGYPKHAANMDSIDCSLDVVEEQTSYEDTPTATRQSTVVEKENSSSCLDDNSPSDQLSYESNPFDGSRTSTFEGYLENGNDEKDVLNFNKLTTNTSCFSANANASSETNSNANTNSTKKNNHKHSVTCMPPPPSDQSQSVHFLTSAVQNSNSSLKNTRLSFGDRLKSDKIDVIMYKDEKSFNEIDVGVGANSDRVGDTVEKHADNDDDNDDVVTIFRHFVPGSIAEREYKKWYNAVEMPNNPYAPEALKKRISGSQERFIDLPNISPTKDLNQLDISNDPAIDEDNFKLENDYRRYSRDYYINSSLTTQQPQTSPTKEPSACIAKENPEPRNATTSCTKAESKSDVYKAIPAHVIEEGVSGVETKSPTAKNLPANPKSVSEESDTIKCTDVDIKASEIDAEEKSSCPTTTKFESGGNNMAPARGSTPVAFKFLQPKRKLLEPKQVLSVEAEGPKIASNQLEKPVIEEEVVKALPSVKALARAFLMTTNTTQPETLWLRKARTLSHGGKGHSASPKRSLTGPERHKPEDDVTITSDLSSLETDSSSMSAGFATSSNVTLPAGSSSSDPPNPDPVRQRVLKNNIAFFENLKNK